MIKKNKEIISEWIYEQWLKNQDNKKLERFWWNLYLEFQENE